MESERGLAVISKCPHSSGTESSPCEIHRGPTPNCDSGRNANPRFAGDYAVGIDPWRVNLIAEPHPSRNKSK